jgi:ABC-2 type transport system permease protein
MNLRHVWLIIKREYLERFRSSGFIIGTLLGIVGLAGLSFLPALFELLEEQSAMKVAVVDTRSIIYPYIPDPGSIGAAPADPASAQAQAQQGTARLQFIKADTEDEEELSRQVTDGKIGAYVVVQGESASDVVLELHSKERPSITTSQRIFLLLNTAATQAKIRESGLSQEQAAALFTPPTIKVEPLAGGTLRDEQETFQSQMLVYVLLLLLYMTLVMYGVQVATGVVMEKSSRVMEVLITTVRPIELMIGKVVGIGLLGLTQYGAWVAVGFLGLVFSGTLSGLFSGEGGAQLEIALVPAATLIYFLVFFILGYLVYATLYAALGSLVNRTEDVNSITTPLTILMVGTYLLSFVALGNPETEYIRWLSFVPFLSPMLMFIRVALSSPAWWEPLLSIVLLLAAILFFAWVAAKIYRVGVLMYGKRPSFREIGRLLRAA